MALSNTDLKKGTIFQLDGQPYRVVDYAQKVMGRGGSIVNVRIKSLIDGKVLSKTFKGAETLESADIASRQVQFLYREGDIFHFMDTANYEQFELSGEEINKQAGFMKDGDMVTAQFFDDKLIAIELSKNLPLKVTYTEDAVRGDTSSAITKDAKLETGLVVKVPAFIKTGDEVSISTEDGSYRGRV